MMTPSHTKYQVGTHSLKKLDIAMSALNLQFQSAYHFLKKVIFNIKQGVPMEKRRKVDDPPSAALAEHRETVRTMD